jgi:peptide deformylase
MELIENDKIENCVCEEVKEEEIEEMIQLGKEMIDFCSEKNAAGLSGPQIGVFKKIFVYKRTQDSYQIIFNPSYIRLSKKPIKVIETCLSYKENYIVERSKSIQAIYYTVKNNKLIKKGEELSKEKAIYFQHETDHLSGITIRMIGKVNG